MNDQQRAAMQMALEAGGELPRGIYPGAVLFYPDKLERFAALVAEATKEKIIDEWRMCVDADLEHGIKSSNERAWAKWQKEYPNVSKFAESVEKLK